MYKAGNKLWHTDSSFKRLPSLCSLLYSRTIAPVGGHTEFADQRAAYDALPEATKQKLHGLVAEHWIVHSRRRSGFTEFNEDEMRRLPPVPQVLVRTIPESGRKSLYVASHAGRIFGMPDEEGPRAHRRADRARRRSAQFVYTHRWRPNELVMWDNRCTMHRGTDYDDLRWVRDMQRVTISDVANSCEQEGVTVAAIVAVPQSIRATFRPRAGFFRSPLLVEEGKVQLSSVQHFVSRNFEGAILDRSQDDSGCHSRHALLRFRLCR